MGSLTCAQIWECVLYTRRGPGSGTNKSAQELTRRDIFFWGGIEPRVYGFEFRLSNQHWAMSSFIEFGCRAWCLTAIGSVDGKQTETMLLSNQIRSALLIHTINVILLLRATQMEASACLCLPPFVTLFPVFLLILIVLSLLLVVQKCSYQPESRCLWWCVLCGGACDEALLCSCW